MSSAHSLYEIADRVDELLFSPANMAVTRDRVRTYLDGTSDGTIGAVADRLPGDQSNGFFSELSEEEELGNLPPLTVEQNAAALAALHDVHCLGVEKVVAIHDPLPDWTLSTESRRAMQWAATCSTIRRLGDSLLPWFNLQLRRFAQNLPERAPPPLAISVRAGGADERTPIPDAYTDLREFARCSGPQFLDHGDR